MGLLVSGGPIDATQKTPLVRSGVRNFGDRFSLFGWLCLLKADDAVACFPFTAFPEEVDAFEPLQYIAFYGGAARRFVARML